MQCILYKLSDAEISPVLIKVEEVHIGLKKLLGSTPLFPRSLVLPLTKNYLCTLFNCVSLEGVATPRNRCGLTVKILTGEQHCGIVSATLTRILKII